MIARSVSALTGLLCFFAGLSLCLVVSGLADAPAVHSSAMSFSVDPSALSLAERVGGIALAIFLASLGMIVFVAGGSPSAEEDKFYELNRRDDPLFGDASVFLARRAAQALTAHVARGIDGIRECEPQVRLDREGWVIDVEIALRPGVEIPALSDDFQLRIRDEFQRITGRPVHHLKIRSSFQLGQTRRRVA